MESLYVFPAQKELTVHPKLQLAFHVQLVVILTSQSLSNVHLASLVSTNILKIQHFVSHVRLRSIISIAGRLLASAVLLDLLPYHLEVIDCQIACVAKDSMGLLGIQVILSVDLVLY